MTTYIAGEKYQGYIPVLLYSIQKSHPDYRVVLFLHEPLNSEIKRTVEQYQLNKNVRFIENAFADCPQMTSLKAKALRWVLWDDEFNDFDYLYTIDTDMFYMKEKIDMAEQHIRHMSFCGLPFSNVARYYPVSSSFVMSVLQRMKHAGLKRIGAYLLSVRKKEYRLSGLHFVDRKEYYKVLSPDVLQQEKHEIYTGDFLKRFYTPNNETYLYRMLSDHGFEMSKVGVQHDPVALLSPDNPERLEFRPHHGIHLGCFRFDVDTLKRTNGLNGILNSQTYLDYIADFKKILLDPLFQKIYSNSPMSIQNEFGRLLDYYNIQKKF